MGVAGTAMLPITHKDDYLALYWVFSEAELPEGADIWVTYSPARGFLSSAKACLGINIAAGDHARRIKAPQERLDL